MLAENHLSELQFRMELAQLPDPEIRYKIARRRWLNRARGTQFAPLGDDWHTCLWLCGRGFGKTRTGAEDMWHFGWLNPGTRLAVIAPTTSDARDTCFEGESGLLSVIPKELVDTWNRTLLELVLTNGTRYKGFSADEPQRLRGPQHHRAWADELGAWRYPQECLDQISLGLRLGPHPKLLITTTPIPSPEIRKLAEQSKDPANGVRLITGSTFENSKNVSAQWLKTVREKYEGTRLGRQELYAEVLGDTPGALWTNELLDHNRIKELLVPLKKIVIGVDPSVTSSVTSDETGIVVAGLGEDDHGYVMADETVERATPDTWANKVCSVFHRYGAGNVVVEVNNGGELVTNILSRVDNTMPVKSVYASVGKFVRAEPMSLLYERGKIHHVGVHGKLESQMTTYVPGLSKKSPDRLDALVWALSELFPRTQEPVIVLPKIVYKPGHGPGHSA